VLLLVQQSINIEFTASKNDECSIYVLLVKQLRGSLRI